VNATEGDAILQGIPALRNELNVTIDDRTLEIIKRRHRTSVVQGRGWLVRRMLFLADIVGLTAAFVIAELVLGPGAGPRNQLNQMYEILLFVLTLPGWLLVTKLYGLYERDEERTDHSTVDELAAVFHMVTVGSWLLVAAVWVTNIAEPDFRKLVLFWALAVTLVTAGRASARAVARRSLAYLQNTVIVGGGDVGQLIARKLLHHPEYGINLVGFVDDAPKERRDDLGHLAILGSPEQLHEIVRTFDVDRVVFAFSNEAHERTLELIRSLRTLNVQVDLVPRLFETIGPSPSVHTVEGLPLVSLPPGKLSRSSRTVKRGMDLLGATIALLLTAPLFAFIAWRIKRDSPGGVFFRQTRLGRNMEEFTVLKFRTMREGTSADAHRDFIKAVMSSEALPQSTGLYKLDQDDAVTKIGKWLRKTSLDELPQLINVLRGEMSLVGPRPSLPYEVENFAQHHFERFNVAPGMTGLWQVTARSHSTWSEALDLDTAYVAGWSLGLDLTLICRTPRQLLRRTGAA
jgi:exopolysaccharide biosynthesis polyprenyl glycosylphosphotransferase